MESNDNLNENIRQLRNISENIYSTLKDISDEQIGCADELEKVRSKLQNLNASMSVINKASNSLGATIRRNEELLSFGLSLSNEIMKKTKNFLQIIDTLSYKLNTLIGKREDINSIVEKLLSLNQASANTARNAEIKAYQAGSQGRGFEVVANELGKLTGESLRIVDSMVTSLETLRDESKKIVDRFKTLQDTLSQFEEITNQLEESSNDLKEKFSTIINITDCLIESLDRINTKRQDIDLVANTMLSLSQNFILKAGKIDLLLTHKESVGEIIEHLVELHQYLKSNNSPLLLSNIRQLDSALNAIFRLNENSRVDVANLKGEQVYKELDFNELQDIKDILNKAIEEMKGVKGIVQSTLNKSKQGIDSINKVRVFIEQEKIDMKEVTVLQENLYMRSNELGRLVERIDDLYDQSRVLSLYGKIEGSRISSDFTGLESIVNEMHALSDDYSKVASELSVFFAPVKEEIEELDKMVQKLNGIINRLGEMVIESENAFKGNEEQIRYLIEISNSIKLSLDKQKDIIAKATDSFTWITDEINENAQLITELEKRMDKEKEFVNSIVRENLRETKSLNILGDKKHTELRVYLQGDPLSLDPSRVGDAPSNKVASSIHRGLFDFGFSGGVYPLIVERWDLSPDALEWNFTIRDDIVNHNGKKIDAADVKYSIDRLKGGPNNFIIEPIESINVKGTYSLTIKLKNLFMPLITNLATVGGSIISKGDSSENDKRISGIGPFRFVEWSNDEDIILEAHSDYIFGEPYPSRLVYKRSGSALESFRENLVDIAVVRADEVPMIKKDTELRDRLISSEFLNVNYMGFNFKKTDLPFNDKRVRQALNYAVDNSALIEETESGLGAISRGIFPPGLSVYDANHKGYEYNLHLARELLKEAGYPDGLPDVYKLSISDSLTNINRAKFLKKAFSDIGVRVEIDEYPWGEFLEIVHDGETELFLLGWSADTTDPNNFIFPLFHSSSKGIGGNTLFYSNESVDLLIEEGLREINPSKRERIYKKVENIIVEDAPMVFLTHSFNFTLVNERVFGFKPDPLNYTHYEWMGVQ